jgi:hemolysin III
MTTQTSTLTKKFSLGEEIANAITHGIGAGLSIAALVILIVQAARHGTAWHVISYTIFGSSLILVYLTSTLYHSIPPARKVLFRIDQAVIFLLIAGTYTPFTLVSLRGPWGWTLFGIIWGLAVLGVIFKSVFGAKYEKIALGVYLLMGWLFIIAAKPFVASVSMPTLVALLIGGLFYTGGVGFYMWHKLKFNHMIWHLCVLAGSIAHFFAILFILQ